MRVLSVDVGTVNMGVCLYDSGTQAIAHWTVLAVDRGVQLCEGVLEVMQKLWDSLHELQTPVDKVIIEKQSKRSLRMQAVQNYVHMFCVMQGAPTLVYSPVNKLKGTGQENSGRSNYRARKKAAISLTQQWLAEHPQAAGVVAEFGSAKKRDDLADSLLQALAFCRGSPDRPARVSSAAAVRPRRPTLAQEQSGRYSKSNILHLLRLLQKQGGDVRQGAAHDKKLAKAMKKQYGSAEACLQALCPQQPPSGSPARRSRPPSGSAG